MTQRDILLVHRRKWMEDCVAEFGNPPMCVQELSDMELEAVYFTLDGQDERGHL